MRPKITYNPTSIEIADSEQLLEVAPVGFPDEGFEVYIEDERNGIRTYRAGVTFDRTDLIQFLQAVIDKYG